MGEIPEGEVDKERVRERERWGEGRGVSVS